MVLKTMPAAGTAVLTQAKPGPKRIDWKLAAQLRASGLTYNDVADRVGARGGETIRAGLARRGVSVGIRTALLSRGDNMAKEALAKHSEETRAALSTSVLEHSQALAKVKAKPNLKHIKALGQAIEPLARSAKIIHGWGDAQKQSLVNIQVMTDTKMDEMFQDAIDTTTNSVQQLPESGESPK